MIRVVAAAMMLTFVPAAVEGHGFPAAITASDDAFLRGYPTTVVMRDVHVPQCNAIDSLEGTLAYATIDVTAHVPFPASTGRGDTTGGRCSRSST